MAKAAKHKHQILHNKHVAVLGLAVVFVFALSAVNGMTGFATNDADSNNLLISDQNLVEKQLLPSSVADCDPANPLNVYERIVSHGDGTVTVYSFNACYPGCTGTTRYQARPLEKLSERTECTRN